MPDLPGAVDEPYDRRFVKWMIKNKVGWASARSPVNGFTGWLLLSGAQPRGYWARIQSNLYNEHWYRAASISRNGKPVFNSCPLRTSVLPSAQ